MPSQRALWLLGLGTLLVAAGVAIPSLMVVALILDVAVLLGVFVDLWRVRDHRLSAERDVPPLLAQGERAEILVRLRNPPTRSIDVRLRDALHPSLGSGPLRSGVRLPAGGTRLWSYPLTPRRRGTVSWGPLTVRVLGPLGLAWGQRDLIGEHSVRVYPRVRWGGKVGHLLALAQRRQLGQSPTRQVGEGAEPYALRAYRRGDPPRKIHWRATARHGRLILREDTWEQGARLVILLDCGRSMASTDDDRSKLDHSLATALALLRLAAGRGDRVTLLAYSDRVERRVRVRAGASGLRQAYSELYDLEARLVESAHVDAVEAAMALEPRRAQAVLCTSVTDLAASERLQEATLRLQRRHETLLVNLEDPRVAARVHSRPTRVEEAFAKVAAMEIQLANRRLAHRLARQGVRTITTPADRLAIETLGAYLDRAGRSTRAGRRAASGG